MYRSLVCCFTGHRTIYLQDRPVIRERLKDAILKAAENGARDFVCGGAAGFDMMAGFTVLDMKKQHPSFRLLLVLPCKDQDAKWTPVRRAEYRRLLEAADSITCLSDIYTKTCMAERNQRMVNMSSQCIAYLRRGGTGTSQTVRMAREHGLKIFEL